MSKVWELLVLLVLTTAALKVIIEFLQPLIPYFALGVIAVLVLRHYYNKKTRW